MTTDQHNIICPTCGWHTNADGGDATYSRGYWWCPRCTEMHPGTDTPRLGSPGKMQPATIMHEGDDAQEDTVSGRKRPPTLCQWCDSDTNDMDFCPECGRQVRGGHRGGRRMEKDLCDLIAQDTPRRLADGFAWVQMANYETEDE